MTKTINVQVTKVFEARPLAELVGKANEFSSKIIISMDNKTVNAKSIMGVMGLGIESGKDLLIEAEGNDAEEAIEAMAKFLEA
ncbi:MAG: HPr family phosphocarrier protein [Agathobacter sp.]|nr:HPr family phosphocarrier protein [Agathobacter sp.]